MNPIEFDFVRLVGDEPLRARSRTGMLVSLHGTAEVKSLDSLLHLTPGHALITRPGIPVSLRNCQALQLASCYFDSSMPLYGLADLLDPTHLTLLLCGKSLQMLSLSPDRFRPVASLLTSKPPDGIVGASGRLLLLLEAIGELPRVGLLHPTVPAGIRMFLTYGVDEKLDSLAHNWTLEELSSMLQLDPSYVARLFKAGVGLPPIAYLNMLRAERAASMLLNTTMPCAQVGRRLGWDDPNYFSRRFRQHFGIKPTAYRALSAGAIQ